MAREQQNTLPAEHHIPESRIHTRRVTAEEQEEFDDPATAIWVRLRGEDVFLPNDDLGMSLALMDLPAAAFDLDDETVTIRSADVAAALSARAEQSGDDHLAQMAMKFTDSGIVVIVPMDRFDVVDQSEYDHYA